MEEALHLAVVLMAAVGVGAQVQSALLVLLGLEVLEVLGLRHQSQALL